MTPETCTQLLHPEHPRRRPVSKAPVSTRPSLNLESSRNLQTKRQTHLCITIRWSSRAADEPPRVRTPALSTLEMESAC